MESLKIEMKDVDRRRYEENIREFLPGRIWDVHTHICEEERGEEPQAAKPFGGRLVTWSSRVAQANPIEHLLST